MRGATQSDPWYSEVPVSDDKDPDHEEAAAPAEDPVEPVTDSEDSEDEDDDDDELDALEGEGFDQAVAQAREQAAGLDPDLDPDLGERPYTQEEAGLRSKVGWGRSPIISALVIVVGVFLLIKTWGDFRYFLRGAQDGPRELGAVADIYQGGEFTERFDNEWVVLDGSPDVQHAARMQTRDGWIGFMRLIGSDASLFVAIPRDTQDANNEFPGRFEGRMQRMKDTAQWPKLEVFFNAEEIIDRVELDPAAFVAALQSGSTTVQLADGKGEITLAPTDTLRFVIDQPTARVHLGRTTWPSREVAEATMAALGRPFAFVEKSNTAWVFALHVGHDATDEFYEQLNRALAPDSLASADPKAVGEALARRTTYFAELGDLQLSDAELSFTYGSNTAETGWRVEGDELVAITLESGRLSVPTAAIDAVEVERALRADPDGYLLMADLQPSDVRPSALMFGAVLGVVLLNVWALLVALRRRRAAAQEA